MAEPTAWFAHWYCHCSQLAASSDECPDRCPTHDSPAMHPTEWVELGPDHYPFGLYANVTSPGAPHV